MNSNRIEFLDTARALCCLWIVGVWHVEPYLLNPFLIHNEYTEPITVSVLASFTIISGYFLGGGISSRNEVVLFYKKRVQRFYPLFLVSCITLYIMHLLQCGDFIVDIKQLIFTITGVVCLTDSYPLTIWYFSMLILFYAVTPLITSRKSIQKKLLVGSFIYLVIIIIKSLLKGDNRILIYFPVYFFGLLKSENKNISKNFDAGKFITNIVGMTISVFIGAKIGFLVVLQLIQAFLGSVCIFEISKLVTNNYSKKIWETIGYASMCIYLFHRQFMGSIEIIFGDLPAVTFYVIVIPTCIGFSYCCQRIYDIIIQRIRGHYYALKSENQ